MQSKKACSKQVQPQRTVYTYLERMSMWCTANLEASSDTALGDVEDKDLKSLILLELAKTNVTIKQIDSLLLLIEGKLDRLEQVNKQLQGEVETLKEEVVNIDRTSIALEKGFRFMEEDFADANWELEVVQ